MSETFPGAIVARLMRLGDEVVVWAQRHPGAELAEQEEALLGLMRAALPDVLEAMLPLCLRELQLPAAGRPQACPQCGTTCGVQEWRERMVATRCGRVQFERPWYLCRGCRQGWAPADVALGLAPQKRLSEGLAAWVIRLGAATDFQEAAGMLEELTGVHLAPETVRQYTEAKGAALEAQQQAAEATVLATQEAAAAVERAPGQMVVETDGVMVRYQDGWHEVKLGLVGGHEEGRTQAFTYVAARQPAEAFGRRLLTEAARRGALEIVGWTGPVTGHGLAQLRPVTVLGDGAHWIWTLAAEHFGERVEIVDFYHASQHLWEVAHSVYGIGTVEAATWAKTQRAALSTHGPGPVLEALARLTPHSAEEVALLRREREYFRANQARMAYPDFRAQGLPIGSGAVESAAKHVVQLRMKRPGARWSEQGAHRVLMVRTHLLSNRPLTPIRQKVA